MNHKVNNVAKVKGLSKEFYIALSEATNIPIEYCKALGGILNVKRCKDIIWKRNKHRRFKKPQ